ncbi:Hypothetical protein CAP_8838 [Chondromyces apiculatus DSM 436]|uniref:Uncharacterized protein n=1 Tax=Chondromyces apiculatus DSM 436 TaxID=1192034 RepID=A0A017SWJ2_9BACT|nr:Hypothetical protein CAP_8838 [Chondromyces apiculatus DSM 436]
MPLRSGPCSDRKPAWQRTVRPSASARLPGRQRTPGIPSCGRAAIPARSGAMTAGRPCLPC